MCVCACVRVSDRCLCWVDACECLVVECLVVECLVVECVRWVSLCWDSWVSVCVFVGLVFVLGWCECEGWYLSG